MRCIRRKYILCVQKLTRSNKFPATGNDKRGCSPANRVDSKIRLINGQLFLSVVAAIFRRQWQRFACCRKLFSNSWSIKSGGEWE